LRTLATNQRPVRRRRAVRPVSWDRLPASRGQPQRWLLHLQQLIGNRAVQRLVEQRPGALDRASRRSDGLSWLATVARNGEGGPARQDRRPAPAALKQRTVVRHYPFQATIWRGQAALAGSPALAGPGRLDAGPGQETEEGRLQNTLDQLLEARQAQAEPEAAAETQVETAAAESPEGAQAPVEETVGQPIQVPDIHIPALAMIEKTDSIAGSFTYTGSITRGGAQPSGFGVTRSFGSQLTGITIAPGTGAFTVAATLKHPITYQVRSGTGPDGQVDIASENDGDITEANYKSVTSDLTPDMSDLNGRPPRDKFWAEDLTLRHELVHANDDKNNGPGAMATTLAWLNGRTAGSEAGVRTLLNQIPNRFASALLAALSTEEGEKHAYGDGAPLYESRAKAVKAKGDKGGYP
jgi:hypothetical protein